MKSLVVSLSNIIFLLNRLICLSNYLSVRPQNSPPSLTSERIDYRSSSNGLHMPRCIPVPGTSEIRNSCGADSTCVRPTPHGIQSLLGRNSYKPLHASQPESWCTHATC